MANYGGAMSIFVLLEVARASIIRLKHWRNMHLNVHICTVEWSTTVSIYLSIYLSPIYRFTFLPIYLSIHPCTYLSIQLREKKRDWIFSVCICKHGSSAYGVILVNPSNRFVRLCGPSASGRKCNFPKSLRWFASHPPRIWDGSATLATLIPWLGIMK